MPPLVFELLLIILILWVYLESSKDHPDNLGQLQKIQEIKAILDEILTDLQINTSYHLTVSSTFPYVENKKVIYLPVKHPQTGEFYDDATLLQVALHELAHVICPNVHHTSLFYLIENELISVALEKGYLDNTAEVASDYPCYNC